MATNNEHTTQEAPHEVGHHQATLYAEQILHIGPLPITNALLTSWASVVIIVILSLIVSYKLKKIPGKFQQGLELIYENGLTLADQVTNNRKKSKKIFPLVIAIFFFVLVNNWFGIVPLGGLGIIQTHDGISAFIPFIRSGTADINGTIALAVMSVIGANLFGIFSLGAWKMFNKFVNIKALLSIPAQIRKNPTVLLVAPITFFVGLIEIIGEFAKIASLSFRLFGNVFAGEVLLASMAALMAYFVPIPFLFLEILVGVVQALIFSMLTLVYFTVASDDHDHEEPHSEHNKESETVHEIEEVVLH